MILLGLHFGHDGAVCVLKDGRIAAYISRERQAGVKHAIGVTTHELQLALSEACITENDIDAVTVTSTQGVEMLTGLIDGFALEFARHKDDTVASPLEALYLKGGQDVRAALHFQLRDLFNPANAHLKDSLQYQAYSVLCPEREQVATGAIASVGCLDDFIVYNPWKQGMGLKQISASGFPGIENAKHIVDGFHYPLTVTLAGRTLPGYFIHHHLAHAASVFFRSGFNEASIITHDGFSTGALYHGGMIYHGRGNRVTPVIPHHLELGAMYDTVGLGLKLGNIGPAGKLMGLAPYGKPRFFDERFTGNMYDTLASLGNKPLAASWWNWCMEGIARMGFPAADLGNKDRITDPVNADIAASTQKLFEESMLRAATAAYHCLHLSKLPTANLCLSGGTALNCPANSKIFRESPFDALYIEPSCGDDGLATGSALYVYHHLYNKPLLPEAAKSNNTPYLGPRISEEAVQAALQTPGIQAEKLGADAALKAAADIHENRVIAWFEGGSEVGPRALGHRSILSHPGHADNWERVNRVKQRESWRPFAPSVLAEHAAEWFSGLPVPSPYMLFTGQVKRPGAPAITHVDGSARIQTVDTTNGDYYRVIQEFHRLSGIPLVMNTSFNGPRQPIIETPFQAVAFLLETPIDALYMQGYRVTKHT